MLKIGLYYVQQQISILFTNDPQSNSNRYLNDIFCLNQHSSILIIFKIDKRKKQE